ncbi:MAG TPA: hypothetical protein VFX98_17925, partial [Longimicrobiaceae bacterium]|nr:hypothetical protein [Longimicrobiaceae bacterium]
MGTRLGRVLGTCCLAAAAASAGCRGDRARAGDEAPPADTARPGEAQLRLELPRELGWNARGDVAAVLANGTAAPLRDLRLHLFVPHPVVVLPPDSAPADTTRRDSVPPPVVAATAEGTELTFALAAVAPEAEARVA